MCILFRFAALYSVFELCFSFKKLCLWVSECCVMVVPLWFCFIYRLFLTIVLFAKALIGVWISLSISSQSTKAVAMPTMEPFCQRQNKGHAALEITREAKRRLLLS
ncbi:hypothetical protein VNO77_00302 [Canavalia gladiata]|uniref:Uncharacterized protein n=1 Tax=Canavalia gladiata TaxID=3824 RepID=A0AAN9MP63_CANGL